MFGWRRLVAAFVGGLLVCPAVYADMIPMSQWDVECRQTQQACSALDLLRTGPSSPLDYSSLAGLDLSSVEFLPEADTDVSQRSELLPPQSLTSGPSSLNLCLSALIGLGLCSSAHWVKRLHFGFIPEWYHDGGPFQIGHSFAVSPESICPAPAYCFVQPIWAVEDSLGQYRRGMIASLWRKSQFTPCVLASRGPPCMS